MKNKQERKTNKIELDKYYTPLETAKYCIDKTFEIIGRENITEIIEPSAGAGSFSLQIENCIAYDIKPEHPSIIEQDYLKLELEYKKGRLIIGNPPFGRCLNLALKFYKKSIKECDYISFILPISQLNNNIQLYDFNLIYSEDIGNLLYSNMPVHCCLNIYKKPINGLNKKIIQKLKDIEIIEHRRTKKENLDSSDLRICAFGSIGKISEYPDQYCKEFLINIKNEKLRDTIINTIKNADWNKEYLMTKSPNLLQWQVIKYLKKMIPEIQ